ncbi:hypothetical protein HQ586_00210 [Candidatus Bathyarchaeota archaeon]|nr:hypothetical protein [Candidatus Bathyarchaeota archaeon]
MRARLLILLILISALLPVPVQALDYEEYISLDFLFSPAADFQQMELGRTYYFDVSVMNSGLNIEEGDVLDPLESQVKFSGSLILFVSSTFRREGSFTKGDETVQYQHWVHSRDESYEVDFPGVGESNVLMFLREIDYGYDLEDVDLDEWVTLTIDASLYFKEYAVVGGETIYQFEEKITEAHMKYYVTSPDKADYVDAAIDLVGADLAAASERISAIESDLGTTLSVDLSDYEAQYSTMRSQYDAGDYISALAEAEAYNSTWRGDLIEVMKQRVEEIRPIERLLEEKDAEIADLNGYYASQIEALEDEYSEQLSTELENYVLQVSELTEEKGRLEGLYLNSTALYEAEVDDLRADLSAVRSNNRIYLLLIVAFLGVFIMLIWRIIRRR